MNYKKMYYQQGGQVDPQQIMQQIAQLFQQLPPEAQVEVAQGLAGAVQQQSAPQEQQMASEEQQMAEQQVMRMGGIRPPRTNNTQMYR